MALLLSLMSRKIWLRKSSESASDAQKNATAVYNAMVEYVRNALTTSKESQKKLADRAGVSQGTVTSFLSVHRIPANRTIQVLIFDHAPFAMFDFNYIGDGLIADYLFKPP